MAGLLHNIGLFSLPEELLLTPGRLNSIAKSQISEHPARGEQALAAVPELKEIASWVRWHHEANRWPRVSGQTSRPLDTTRSEDTGRSPGLRRHGPGQTTPSGPESYGGPRETNRQDRHRIRRSGGKRLPANTRYRNRRLSYGRRPSLCLPHPGNQHTRTPQKLFPKPIFRFRRRCTCSVDFILTVKADLLSDPSFGQRSFRLL